MGGPGGPCGNYGPGGLNGPGGPGGIGGPTYNTPAYLQPGCAASLYEQIFIEVLFSVRARNMYTEK